MDPSSPITVESELLKVKIADLKTSLPGFALEGNAELEVTLTIDIVPDYTRLAAVAKSGGQALSKSVAKSLKHVQLRVRGVTVRLVTAGRHALQKMLDRFVGKPLFDVALRWANNLAASGQRTSATGSARKAFGRFGGPALGAASLWLRIQQHARDVADAALRGQIEQQRRKMRDAFRLGYSSMLVDLTAVQTWDGWLETVRTRGIPRQVWIVRPERRVEDWIPEKVDRRALQDWLRSQSTRVHKTMVRVADDDWYQRLVEVEVAAVFAMKGSPKPELTRQLAYDEARLAGEAACYQDVIQFLSHTPTMLHITMVSRAKLNGTVSASSTGHCIQATTTRGR